MQLLSKPLGRSDSDNPLALGHFGSSRLVLSSLVAARLLFFTTIVAVKLGFQGYCRTREKGVGLRQVKISQSWLLLLSLSHCS